MNRMFRAGLLALPLLLAAAPAASANDFGGPMGTRSGCNQYGCQGFCLGGFFKHINQHGPLVNYGPYDGMWDGWGGACGWNGRACGRAGCGRCGGGLFGGSVLGLLRHGNSGCDSGNCGGWGGYARSLFRNVGHRTNPFGGVLPACSTCSH
jgi:hypothetical protein